MLGLQSEECERATQVQSWNKSTPGRKRKCLDYELRKPSVFSKNRKETNAAKPRERMVCHEAIELSKSKVMESLDKDFGFYFKNKGKPMELSCQIYYQPDGSYLNLIQIKNSVPEVPIMAQQ